MLIIVWYGASLGGVQKLQWMIQVNILMAFLKAVEFVHQAGAVRAYSKAVSRLQCLITVSTGLGKPAFIYALPL